MFNVMGISIFFVTLVLLALIIILKVRGIIGDVRQAAA